MQFVNFLTFLTNFVIEKFCHSFFSVEKWNVGDLKHVFPKFEAEWSYPREVNGRSKFCKNSICFRFQRRKMKLWGSSERHFPKVWGRTEPSLGVRQPVKVLQNFRWTFSQGSLGARSICENRKCESPTLLQFRGMVMKWSWNGYLNFTLSKEGTSSPEIVFFIS